MKKFLYALLGLALLAACSGPGFSREERAIIDSADPRGVMRVLTLSDRADSLVLRKECKELSAKELTSEEFSRLKSQMVATVSSPEQDGVGIAGPQVGIVRRVIAVQRLDKEGEPFEVYPNVRIVEAFGPMLDGSEGCLSIPGWRGRVLRSEAVVIEYSEIGTEGELRCVQDTIHGYTARIFQHECDHLDGILYTDRAVPGTVVKEER